MKYMISQPMKGKTEQQVRAERESIIQIIERLGGTVVDTVFPDFSNKGNIPLKYLAKSLEAMADVDIVLFMDGWELSRGCRIEHQVCKDYGISVTYEYLEREDKTLGELFNSTVKDK